MVHSRYEQLAELLVTYSVRVHKEQKVLIRVLGVAGLPLGRFLYQAVLSQGGYPYVDITDEETRDLAYRHATTAQLAKEPEADLFLVAWADAIITIAAPDNVRALSRISADKLILTEQGKKGVRDIVLSKPWVTTYVPTHGIAQEAGMSLAEFEDLYFGSTLIDWATAGQRFQRLADALSGAQTVHIVGEDTDLRFSVAGRTFVADKGECNMPGGEIFTAPVEDSLEGHIFFSFPLLKQGKYIRDIHLFFEAGKIVKAIASENQAFLEKIIATDAGSRYMGEFAIGMNPGLTEYVNNMLFDEKIEGTIHMAVGEAYQECGGTNRSVVHMDIVKDMRVPGSIVTIDEKPVLVDGKLVF